MTFLEKFKKKCAAIDAPPLIVPEKENTVTDVKRRLFNIHKRSLPVGIDKVVVYHLKSKEEAQRMIERATDSQGKPLFATRSYNDDTAESKTLIYFDIVPVDAMPNERSIYFNERPVTRQ